MEIIQILAYESFSMGYSLVSEFDYKYVVRNKSFWKGKQNKVSLTPKQNIVGQVWLKVVWGKKQDLSDR